MAGPSYRKLRRLVAVVACLICTAAVLTESPTAGSAARRPFRVLQLNLCNSGIAGCYTGRSVAQASTVIRADPPDVVTLNEVCHNDISTLEHTLSDAYRGGAVVSAFRGVTNRRTGAPVRCRNGQPYGIGVLARLPVRDHHSTVSSGTYPMQNLRDPEERAWLCLYTSLFYACTTHLESANPPIALEQCGYLMGTAIPSVRLRGGYEPTVLGGDFNLKFGDAPDVRSCIPPGYLQRDDTAVQHVVATTDFTVTASRSIAMDGTTDHPGLLVTLAIPPTY
jgi:endonuclease/exonuclease/phosphatase family metal-dependent hydrolase